VVTSGPDASLVGKTLDDRYEILELIGHGGVGVVYRARRVKLDRMVVVKVLQDSLVEDDDFVRRFQREAVAMSRLHHPHCVAVIDFGVHETRPYLVLEYVPGETVTKLLGQGPFKPVRAVQIALQLLETLEYFHRNHVIHRDLKSENVMLVESESGGTEDFVKVLDFGMAKILTGPGADSQLSMIGLLAGTPSAMAPEQIRQLPPDPRIDIYSTGILLYEMIVGRRPFRGSDREAVLRMQISTPPEPPRKIVGENALSAELERVIIRALEKDRVDRYGTVDEMAAELRMTPEGRVTVSAPAGSQRGSSTPGWAWRGKWLLLAGVAAATALVGLSATQLRRNVKSASSARAAATAATAAAAATTATLTAAPPSAIPTPQPVVESWLAHRELAISYTRRGQHDDAFREIGAAVAADSVAAGADQDLLDALAEALTKERVSFMVDAFHANPRLVEVLANVAANGASFELRHAAYDQLRTLGQDSHADLIGMRLLDLDQAPKCSQMRAAFKELRTSKDPRVKILTTNLRSRSRKDPQLKCLHRLLRR
jgi:serine/threonine-protein kinase